MAGVARYNIGRRLREIRTRAGQTLEEVAKSLRISAGGISNVELGHADPSLALLIRLSEHFHVSLNAFFDDDPARLTNAAESFFREFDASLEAEDWKILATIARALTEKQQRRNAR